MAEFFMIGTDALGDVPKTQRIGIKHRTSKVAREAVAAGPVHIDIRGARCCKILVRSVC